MTDHTHPEASAAPGIPEDLTVSPVGAAGVEYLTTGVIWVYSLPRIAFGIMGLLFGTYLMKFATDVLFIAPAAMGLLIAISRLWDGISDPVAGYFSDKTNSRFGRRRTWMFAASIPMGLSMIMIWSPPTFLEGAILVVWMGAALLLYETASTAFFVPHGAIGPELTPNYHERTRLYGYSHMIGAIGTLIGLVSLHFMNIADDKRTFAAMLSLVAGFSVTAIVIWSTRMLPERADYQGRGGVTMYGSFGDVFKNPHARLLLIVYGIETFGAASVGMLVPYLVEYVIPMQAMMVPLLLTYTIPQFIFTPIWIRLARRFGKKKLWAFSMWLNAAVFFCYFWVVEPGLIVWFLSFMLGFAAGCGAVVAPAIKADVIDYDEYMSDQRKEGAYLAVWNLIRKCAASVTAVVTGLVLQFSGFEPNMEQTEETKLALRSLFGLLPCACYVIGALLFVRFNFNEKEHGDVRRVLAERELDRKT